MAQYLSKILRLHFGSNKVKSVLDEAGVTNGMSRDEFLDAVEALCY